MNRNTLMKSNTLKANNQEVIQNIHKNKNKKKMKCQTDNNKEVKSNNKSKDHKWIKVYNLPIGNNTKGKKSSLYLRFITMTYQQLRLMICVQKKSLMKDLPHLITITERLNIPNLNLIPADLSVSFKSTEEHLNPITHSP